MLKVLWARLVVATLLPVVLVTVTLYPIFAAHLEERVDSTRQAAEAWLESEYDMLLQGMNESLNQVLATAEFPLLGRFLGRQQAALTPTRDIALQHDREQLEALFDTLLTHFGRYTRLALIDANGHAMVAATATPLLSLPPVVDYGATSAFQEAMLLQQRDLYVSPPHLGASRARDKPRTAVIDIATPVFDDRGQRLGVLMFTLDWSRFTATLPHVREDSQGEALLVDAQGTWLLPGDEAHRVPFGRALANERPAIWQAMSASNQGMVILDEHLLGFRSHDIRTHHYRSQAGMITSEVETQPWRLGVLMPKPGLTDLLSESPVQLLAIALVYLLSVAFGVFWVLSNHRLRSLRQRALQFSREARQNADEVQDLYEHAPCGYHSLDSDGRVLKINRTELEWLGYRAEEVIGKRCYRDFVTPETRAAFDQAFQQVLGLGQEGAAECELLCRDGTRLPVVIQATAHVTEDGFQYSRATVFDLSERKKLEERLAEQAMTDPLTGLGNRRYLEDQATMEIARAERSGAPLSLIAIDLDHFKRINDTYGHDVGDLVLQEFAHLTRQMLRDGDVLCRMGGEEFAIMLPGTGEKQAMQVAERLRQAIERAPAKVGRSISRDGTLAYSISLGVTLVNAGETSLKLAIKRADKALYTAKQNGRNRAAYQK
ncbi:sensor domain-containing diguanylate cyclase [Billgrantia gudaonensis]|uniref:diguanylate cyclase n=1 Tax=Billgrantia gudaonensis TaxID=376427 RepID=A0A1G8Y776_9GAMM|nr:diguanylate cyclase [Halomonas gudaonensis]SDJ98035.1 PAS domain S-box-containing protein/diguanylate cyclase (GGDEF) domain-containing protein [Halomonas gudaonensis]